MPSELETPTRRPEPESTTDASLETDDAPPFPYDTSDGVDSSTALPTATARVVLESADGAPSAGSAGSTACPACGSDTMNGAGLFACLECPWTGALR